MGRVSGKVVIVTGGARGLGAAFARRLVEEGAKVMITDVLDQEGQATAQTLGANARFMHHDVTKEDQWRRIVVETESAFGPVSVLVNNAGISTITPSETLEEAEYRRIIDVNQVAVFLGMKSVLPSMKRAGGGSIVNISSAAGIVGLSDSLAYNASKFAVRGMTKSAAIDFAPYNIRVNSIHPGIIRTEMMAKAEAATTIEAQRLLSSFLTRTPAGRVGEPDEVANMVLLLASDEVRFSTGAEFIVDGGYSCQ